MHRVAEYRLMCDLDGDLAAAEGVDAEINRTGSAFTNQTLDIEFTYGLAHIAVLYG